MDDFARDPLTPENPWPGLASFSEREHGFFFGRDRETQALLRLVRRETLTVLHGRSGLGKTSLLNAGLFPLLRDEARLPVYIRLDHAPDAAPLVQQVFDSLLAACERAAVRCTPPAPDETLWSYFQRHDVEFWNDRTQLVAPVIVFDQFEEIFTAERDDEAARARAAHFFIALSEVVENRPPEAVRSLLERDPAAAGRFEFTRARVKVILSLRKDFLAELEGCRKLMPSLMYNRLPLTAMSGDQAYSAITRAGGGLVDDDIARRIIQLAWKNEPAPPAERSNFEFMEIDPPLLSVVCSELNRKRIDRGLPFIDIGLLEGADREILSSFYHRSMKGCPDDLQKFVEEELITSRGDRDSRDYLSALTRGDHMRDGLELLVRRRLLRIDERRGVRRLELAHDVLTSVVRESRDIRRAREAMLEARRRRIRNAWRAFGATTLCVAVIAVLVATSERHRQRVRHDTLMARADSMEKSNYDRALLLHLEAMRTTHDAGDSARLMQRILAHPELITFLRGHEAPVFGVAYSDDSMLLVSSSYDHTTAIWDAATHGLLGVVTSAPTELYGAAFRPKTHEFVTANGDAKTVTLWDADTRTKIRDFGGFRATVVSVAFNRDGTMLAACDIAGNVLVWPLAGHAEGTAYQGAQSVTNLAFSGDGKLLAVSTTQRIVVWQVTRPDRPLAVLSEKRSGGFYGVAFSPDDRTLAMGETSGYIDMFDMGCMSGSAAQTVFVDLRNVMCGGASPRKPLQGHTEAVRSLAFSPDGQQLASSSGDRTVMIWDVATSKPVVTLSGHTDKVFGVAWRADGLQIASASQDRSVILWHPDASGAVTKLPVDDRVVTALAYSPDGKRLAAASGSDQVVIWDRQSLHRVALSAHDGVVTSISFSPDSTLFASGGWDRTVKLWRSDADAQSAPLRIFPQPGRVTSVVFSPDGSLLAAAAETETTLTDLRTGAVVARYPRRGVRQEELVLAFSVDGTGLISGRADGRILLRDLRAVPGSAPRELFKCRDAVSGLALSHDGKRLAASDWHGVVYAWDTANFDKPVVMEEHQKRATGVAFGATSDDLASVGWDRNVILHDMREIRSPVTIGGATARLQAVAFSPDGKQLAAAGFDGSVSLWDIDPAALREQACAIANRNLTSADWPKSADGAPSFHCVCEGVPCAEASAGEARTASSERRE
ncbi:nSTAND1 domain-containing NTPase [Paraburkholderia sp. RL17-337-BIB-A]|uniref:nSTAND1 domain-containing NTPase n=1 Tax=Paraburkholderia sp. RL17-337-BIB-A TaxID=3031636 RepID=UPI0038B8AF92